MVRGWSRRVASLLLGVVAMAGSSTASAWWNDDWQFRKELALDLSAAGANIPEGAQDVPVLLRLSIANFPYFADAKPDGSDLRVIAGDDKTPLKFHVEKFDAQAQIALLWVRMPQITGGMNADKIYLYYGSQEGSAAGDAAGTYDTGQAVVYHFVAGSSAQDSSSYKNDLQGLTAAANAGSIIGDGLRLDGNSAFTVAASPSLALSAAKGYTISAWVRPEGAQNSVIAALRDQSRELALGINGDKAFARWRDGAEVLASQPTGSLAGDWHLVALRAEGSKLALLVDGVEVAQVSAKLQDLGGSLQVGGAGGAAFYRGEVDELQVANVARSAAWLRAAAQSQGMVAPLVVYGGDSQKEGGEGEGYFAATMHSVTFDGWVVIGILSVMFLASVAIMIGKLQFLTRVASGNRKFLDEFHRLRDDPALLERKAGDGDDSVDQMTALDTKNASYGISTLWRLYHHGMQETMKRVGSRATAGGSARTLTPQAIESIRATLDATQTRMTQRMQSQMVWLTISIAGGPFLGLLGTVVGVMITFAAIAASGEVNVNAIAPGTAAALVATVAGLGVAIPCLFGYNYLNTRIKEIVADMRVFVDEFVTRIAETYS
jgi:biopolymer transport protein ExbB